MAVVCFKRSCTLSKPASGENKSKQKRKKTSQQVRDTMGEVRMNKQ